MSSSRPHPVQIALLLLVGALLGGFGLWLAAVLPGDAAALLSYQDGAVCLSESQPPDSCVSETRVAVLSTRAEGSRTVSYDVELQVPGAAVPLWATSVDHSLYIAVHPGETVQAELWRGQVATVATLDGGVTSTTLAEPGRQLENRAVGAWMVLGAATLALGSAALVWRRPRVLAGAAPRQGSARAGLLPTPGSQRAAVSLSLGVAGAVALLTGASLVAWLLWALAGLGVGAAWVALAHRWLWIEVDDLGLCAHLRPGPPVRADWSEVQPVRRSGRRVTGVRIGRRTVPLTPLRLFTAANEPVLAEILRRAL